MWSKPWNWEELEPGALAELVLEAQYHQELLTQKMRMANVKLSQLEQAFKDASKEQESIEFELEDLSRDLNEIQTKYRTRRNLSNG